ncbi:MAG: phage tail protein [Ectothiorhodospiraceae bacterium]|nr:phage tail protein [Ectothiorhodospiraceae bacterium]
MAGDFYTVLTDVGKAKLADAHADGPKVELQTIHAGTGGGESFYDNYGEAELGGLENLVDEVWSDQINHLAVDPGNPNWVVVEGVIPTDQGGWMIREVGIKDVDGDLIAVGRFPETYKPALTDGAAQDLLIRSIMEVSNAANVTLEIDPAVVLASRKWVHEQLPYLLEGELSFGDSSEGWARDDFESLAFDPEFPDDEYQVTFERPDSIEAQRLGDLVVYDKAPNGCKVRATGSGGGTVRWKATRWP